MSARVQWLLPRLALVIGSMAVTSAALEVVLRIHDREFGFDCFVERERDLFTQGYPAEFDARLGWVPKAGAAGRQNRWNTRVTIDEHGHRSNGTAASDDEKSSRSILAVGDSFTFGDEVSDDETWPAQLERRVGARVINAGVFGYGVDQAFLRTEMVIAREKPDVIILSVFHDDINRCELSERTAVGKPVFDVRGAELVLKNVPVPPPSDGGRIGAWRAVLGHSYFVHSTLMRVAPGFWLEGKNWLRSTRIHDRGVQVTCRLLSAFEDLAIEHGARLVIVLQYTRDLSVGRLPDVMECFHPTTSSLVDLRPILAAVERADAARFATLFRGHMTAAGNQLVAESLADHLKSLDLLQAASPEVKP